MKKLVVAMVAVLSLAPALAMAGSLPSLGALKTGTVVGRYALPPVNNDLPGPLNVASDGTNLWSLDTAGVPVVVMNQNGVIIRKIGIGPTKGGLISGMAFDGTNMWVANGNDGTTTGTVVVIGPKFNIIKRIKVGYGPCSLAFDGTSMWVANNMEKSVQALNLNGTVRTYSGGMFNGPSSIAFDGTNLWVQNGGDSSLTEIDTSGNFIRRLYGIGAGSGGPNSIIPDGTNIWVLSSTNNSVTKIDLNGNVIGTYGTGSYPYAGVFDGTNIWVMNAHDGTVTVLNAQNGSLVETYPVDPHSTASAAFDGTYVWTSDGMNVIKIWDPRY